MLDVGCWNALSLQSPHPDSLAFWGWTQTVTYNYVNFKPYKLLTLLSDSSECVRDLPKEHQVESKSTGQGRYRPALELMAASVGPGNGSCLLSTCGRETLGLGQRPGLLPQFSYSQ